MAISVVIADDHDLIVRGMVDALETHGGFEIAATADNGVDAIVAAKVHRPDILLLDMSMPDANGLEVFAEVRRWTPETRVAIITGNPTPALFAQLESSGIDGLFLKNSPVGEICSAIERIVQGERVISDAARAAIDAAHDQESLSPRELEVLHGVAMGLTNATIAERLSISPKTVDNHRTSLMRKLNVRTSAAMVAKAMKSGLVTF